MIEIVYGCEDKRRSKPVMKGSRLETIERQIKNFQKREAIRTSIYKNYF